MSGSRPLSIPQLTVRSALSSVALGAALAAVLLSFARRLPNFVVPDDGYFYSQIAYHLGLHGRSTFDGVHTTSGYHLPWALVLAAVSRLIGVFTLDKSIHLFGHLVVALSLAIATIRAHFTAPLFRACALVLLVSAFSLTEMVLAAPILLALLGAVAEDERVGLRAPATWLAFALPLVRVDLACAPLTAAALLCRRDTRRAAWLAGAAALGVAAQLAAMQLAFGHFMSVAAWLKANATLWDVPDFVRINVTVSAFVALTFAAHAALAALALTWRPTKETWTLVLTSTAFLGLHTSTNVLRGWYWVPSWVGLLFTLERAPAHAPRRRWLRHATRACVAAIALAFIAHATRAEIHYAKDQRASAAFLSHLRGLVPPGARLFTSDNPGFLGFFSGYDVVDGDGLVNDFAFARRLRSGRLGGYLEEEGLCWIVSAEADARPAFELAGIVLDETDVERLVTVRRHVASQADFVLLRLRAPRCAP